MSLKSILSDKDSPAQRELHVLVSESISGGPSLNQDFLRDRNWFVGPAVGQPERADCERIVAVARNSAVERLFVVSVEDVANPEALEIPIDAADLEQALGAEHRSLTNMVLYCLPSRFLVFKDATDFFLVCGPRIDVENILASKIELAWKDFEVEAASRVGDTRYLDLRPIIEKYRHL